MSGVYFFFFKQKTAYEMRISDWSSDVCSSDLPAAAGRAAAPAGSARSRPRRTGARRRPPRPAAGYGPARGRDSADPPSPRPPGRRTDRKSVVSGKSVSVRVDLVGRRVIKTKTHVRRTYT